MDDRLVAYAAFNARSFLRPAATWLPSAPMRLSDFSASAIWGFIVRAGS
jgi:hypothetical protein